MTVKEKCYYACFPFIVVAGLLQIFILFLGIYPFLQLSMLSICVGVILFSFSLFLK